MSAARGEDVPVALLFRIAPLPGGNGRGDAGASALPEYRLGWVIYAAGTPLLTLDCRVPVGTAPDEE